MSRGKNGKVWVKFLHENFKSHAQHDNKCCDCKVYSGVSRLWTIAYWEGICANCKVYLVILHSALHGSQTHLHKKKL